MQLTSPLANQPVTSESERPRGQCQSEFFVCALLQSTVSHMAEIVQAWMRTNERVE